LGDVTAVSPELIDVYMYAAAGAKSKMVRVELYRADLEGEPHAQSKIGELVWFGPGDDQATLTFLIFPDLIRRRLWQPDMLSY
jgi:hypothetical protein